MQVVRKKKCRQYFFAGILLLSLPANTITGSLSDAGQQKAAEIQAFGFIVQATGLILSPIVDAVSHIFLIPYIKSFFKPQIIICSSRDNSKKPNQEMVFSDEVKLKLDGFSDMAKKVNEIVKNNEKVIKDSEPSVVRGMLSRIVGGRVLREFSDITRQVDKLKKLTSMITYRNLLLHGPPGTGKTEFAKKLARRLHDECGMEWVMITGSSLFQGGGYVKSVNDIFIKEVKKNKGKGLTIIIDEADSLLLDREKVTPGSNSHLVINHILSFMGTRTNDRMVIMTSNYLARGEAIKRRTDFIKVPLPKNKERVETLRLYRKSFALKSLTDKKIDQIAADTEGFSQSDLSGIIDKLKMKSVIDGDTDVEKNADTIVEEYHEKKQLFEEQEQQQKRDRSRLEELKVKRYS